MRHSFHALAVDGAAKPPNPQGTLSMRYLPSRHSFADSCKLEGMTDKLARLVCYAHSIIMCAPANSENHFNKIVKIRCLWKFRPLKLSNFYSIYSPTLLELQLRLVDVVFSPSSTTTATFQCSTHFHARLVPRSFLVWPEESDRVPDYVCY